MERRSSLGKGAITSIVLLWGCGGGTSGDGGGSGIDLDTGEDTESATGTTGDTTDGADSTSGGPSECLTSSDCDGGACLDGVCCAVESVCGDVCCGGQELCLFGACVVPGSECTTAEDCAQGEYCEPAFGDPGGGMGTPPEGLVCTQPLPATGACIAAPEICGDPGADPQTCLDACEVQIEPGDLDTTIKWQWGLIDAGEYPDASDVWATPTVARLYDANCDGRVDENDPPNMVFVSGDTGETCCSCGSEPISTCLTGVLRVLDGSTGEEIWSLDRAQDGQYGFAGLSVALGDVTGDGYVDIVAMTGDGYVALVDRNGEVRALSDAPIPDTSGSFGWGGGLAIADMDGDGTVEIVYGRSLFRYEGGAITKLWDGTAGQGGGNTQALSYMVDLDGDGVLEVLAGNTAYRLDGSQLWYRNDLGDGFTAVGDLDLDGDPEVVMVRGDVWVLDGASGDTVLGPVDIPFETTRGGPPTVADFEGDGMPEIGVAGGTVYVVYEPNFATGGLDILWQHETKDTSSARTGSSLFDFEGDGRAEVVYSDECFLRVLDGVTGELRFAAPNTTFTATEALIVADVDGDSHAEIVRVSNSANWDCDLSPWIDGDPATGLPPWEPPAGATYYQGLTVFGDAANSWVGTRSVWNQHAYFVSNVCDGHDGACDAGQYHGQIPSVPKDNWTLGWLNNFRQNVGEEGIFNAPDAVVSLDVDCTDPPVVRVAVRNEGLAPLPVGVDVGVYRAEGNVELGTVTTTQALLAGQTQVLEFVVPEGEADASNAFVGRILVDPVMPSFHECREDNNESAEAKAFCGPG
ncbi:MAG: VCBS repeat-containing protein [Myxococcales bacterium]|nr:VCBS repeat-containing protein [Myxococcales bacterium]